MKAFFTEEKTPAVLKPIEQYFADCQHRRMPNKVYDCGTANATDECIDTSSSIDSGFVEASNRLSCS